MAHNIITAGLVRKFPRRGVGRPVLSRVAFEHFRKLGRRRFQVIMEMKHTFVLRRACPGHVIAQPIIFSDTTPPRKDTKPAPLELEALEAVETIRLRRGVDVGELHVHGRATVLCDDDGRVPSARVAAGLLQSHGIDDE